MHGTSLASARAVLAEAEPVLAAAGKDAEMIGEQLLDIVSILDGSGPLRRALTDPARAGADKAGLVKQLFAKSDERTVNIMERLATERWSKENDLADAVEFIGVEAMLIAAENASEMQTVADQLFQFDREVHRHRDLRIVLADNDLPASQRTAVIDKLIGNAHPIARELAKRAVAHPRGRSLTASLLLVGDLAAARRERRVATVTSATPLSESQRDRIKGLLKQIYGVEVQLNVAVEPEVLGGIRIRIGDEIFDATVLTRLSEARRSFAS
ncbi:MAG TPA: F0F1 ATP synthase subunit delta [Actinomycetales bacterium]|nr:F0F1 ATP synthase subunit delta [Actinomycetales bacterium]